MEPKQELLRRVDKVRRRWSRFIWLKGLAWVLGVGIVGLVLSMSIAESAGFPAWAVVALRFGMLGALIGTAVKMLLLPLSRKPDEIQLARFVEEKNPGLEDRLVSAIEYIRKPRTDSGPFGILLIRDALDRTRRIRFEDLVNRRKYNVFATMSGAFVVALIIAVYFAATFFPVGSSRLFAGLVDLPPGPDFSIEISPGNTTVPSGSDVVLEAVMLGFDPVRAEIQLRYDNSSQWEASTMEVAPEVVPTFQHLLFNVREPIRYFVRADGRESEEFVISVADLPQVESIDYTYNYPAYTQMATRTEEDAFDMVALRGTQVDVVVHASQDLEGGQLRFADGQEVELQPGLEQTAMVRVTVDRTTTFRVNLVNTEGGEYLSLSEYLMEALDDQKPIVQFSEPGRDYRASTVEEIFSELEAEDDMGINSLEIRFGVNGGEEQTVDLFTNRGTAPKEMSGSYTFFLEEYEIQPGDFITYYGRATDTNSPPNETLTDIYFIEVRPFGMEYFQGQAGGGGGGGGGGGQDDSAEALSNRQKQIIAATFALQRDIESYEADEYSDNIQAVAENQSTLAEQTETLMGRLTARQLTRDEMIAALTENLELALEQMGPAAQELTNEDLEAASPYEHKALQYLSRAEALYNQVQVSMGAQGGGGGGGGQNAQDLADLFDLELDQSQNQYETLESAEGGQSGNEEIDELLRKLEELAQRQQKMVEDQLRAQQAGGNGNSASQQMTAEEIRRETERLARQLDRLSRERNDPQLAEVSESLNQAAQNMRQAQNGTAQQQQQAAEEALEQMQRAQELMSGAQGGTVEERLANLQREANDLVEQQQEIADQTERLAADPRNDAERRSQQITDQKDEALEDLRELQDELDSLQNADASRETANQIRSAANSIRSNRLVDKMNDGQRLLDLESYRNAALRERQTAQELEDIEGLLSQALASASDTEEERLQTALNEVSEAIQRLESMQRRMESEQQGQQEGQQGQGQEGQQGQGQEGQQGQGQEGQQGQGQEGQQGQQGRGGGQQQQGGQVGGFGGPDGGRPLDGYTGPGTDFRQRTREFEQRLQDLEGARELLGRENALYGDLTQAMNEIRERLEAARVGDPSLLQGITDDIINPLKTIELQISRALGLLIGRENIRIAQEDDIPADYRELVEEYFIGLGNDN